MGEHDRMRQEVAEVSGSLREVEIPSPVVGLKGVSSQIDGEFDVFEERENLGVPEGSALRPGRKITRRTGAWVAEAGGNEGELLWVVERFRRDAEPLAEVVAAAVAPGNAGLVSGLAGRLSNQEDSRGWVSAEQGFGTKRKSGGAHGARPRLFEDGE